jgi:hypothetical protein
MVNTAHLETFVGHYACAAGTLCKWPWQCRVGTKWMPPTMPRTAPAAAEFIARLGCMCNRSTGLEQGGSPGGVGACAYMHCQSVASHTWTYMHKIINCIYYTFHACRQGVSADKLQSKDCHNSYTLLASPGPCKGQSTVGTVLSSATVLSMHMQ